MAWMKIKSFDSNVPVTAQIFEFNSTYFDTIPNRTIKATNSQGYKTVSFIYNRSPFLTEQQAVNLFSDWVYETENENSMIQVNFKYTENNGIYEPDALFFPVQIGVKPELWDSHRWLYYTRDLYTNGSKTFAFYKYAPSTWNNQTQYYEEDTNPRKRGFCRYVTDTGCVFSITRGFAQANTYGNRGTSDFIIRNSQGEQDSSFSGYVAFGNLQINCDISTASENGFYESSWGSGGTIENDSNVNVFFVHTKYNDVDYYGLAKIATVSAAARPYPAIICVTLIDKEFWGTSISDVPPPSPSHWGDDSTTGGGNGTFTYTSDNRGDLTGTTAATEIASANTAISQYISSGKGIKIFNPSASQLNALFSAMYTSNFIEQFLQSRFNPLSCIIAYNLIPSRFVNSTGAAAHCTAAGYDISAATTLPDEDKNIPIAAMLASDNIGSFTFTAHFFDSYPDFAPYTKIYLHLPYIGTIEINANDIMYGSIGVAYSCDVISGNVIAWITCIDKDENSKIITAQGNCAFTLPVFADMQGGQAIGKAVSGLASVGFAALGGAESSALLATSLGVALNTADAATRKNVQTVGAIGGNSGIISDSVCYLEIVRPVWCNPENYQKLNGIPTEISGLISEFVGESESGFVRVSAVDLTNVPATESELKEIESMLFDGIYCNPLE